MMDIFKKHWFDNVLVCCRGGVRDSVSMGGTIRYQERMAWGDIGEGRLLRDLRYSRCDSV
ncbi:hypothetical protein KZ770_11530 [Escherichia coli]|nr:hypothetical protein [Escherichia coli]